MALLPTYKINQFYTEYKTEEVVFNKKVISQIGLIPHEIYLNTGSEKIPCIIYICSMVAAKLVANLTERDFTEIKKSKNSVKLRFAFQTAESKELVKIFVPCMIKGFNSFSESNKSSYMITVTFCHKPPDDLIEILGQTIDIHKNIENRGDIRIPTNEETMQDIGFASIKGLIKIDGKSAVCIIKNISNTGALILTKDLEIEHNDKLVLFIHTKDKVPIQIEAEVARHETLPNNQNICSLGLHFLPDKLPVLFNTIINSYLDELMKKQVFLE